MIRTAALLGVLLGATGCPTVDLGDSPPDPGVCRPDPQYFRDVIWPEYLASTDTAKSCVMNAGCHAADTGRSALRLETDVATDMGALDRNYQVVTRFLNCGSPDASSLLTKPLSTEDQHGGGDIYDPADAEVSAFETWFTL
jgi:hypothetical protein